jgi:hypothetical protein
MMENFERKFDGFPAANESAVNMPAVQEGLIVLNPDDIARLIGGNWQVPTDPCGDCVSQNSVTSSCLDEFARLDINSLGLSPIQCLTWETNEDTLIGNANATAQSGIGRMVAMAGERVTQSLQLNAPIPVPADLEILVRATIWLGTPGLSGDHGEFSVLVGQGMGPDAITVSQFIGSGSPGGYSGFLHWNIAGVFSSSTGSSGGGGGTYIRPFALTKGNTVGAAAGTGVSKDGEDVYIRLIYSSNGVAVKQWKFGTTEPSTSTPISGTTHPGTLQFIALRLVANSISNATVHVESIEIVSGLDCSNGDCISDGCVESGQTVTRQMSLEEENTYTVSQPVRYYVNIDKNGIPQIEGMDYTVDEDSTVVFNSADADDIIMARYVIQ